MSVQEFIQDSKGKTIEKIQDLSQYLQMHNSFMPKVCLKKVNCISKSAVIAVITEKDINNSLKNFQLLI